jgi:tetratricopeptide (TPR) repeat protein
MEQELRGKEDRNSRNDYSVALVLEGRTAEALSLLHDLESSNPGDYSTAANLGTAYELSGKNDLALKWIQEGIRRNPNSHEGTEWVHVKILQAKLQQERDPDYWKKHSVLNLDLSKIDEGDSFFEEGNNRLNAKEVAHAIHYQLQERLQFVRTSDPAVASLLFDYGAIEAATGTVERARELMEMAVEFGFPVDKVGPFYKQFDHALSLRKAKDIAWYSAIAVVLVAFVAYAVKRRWIVYRRLATVDV